MPVPDRLFRSLFVALAVGLAWGIRGDFGHLLGASFPGAALGIAFAYAAGGAAVIRRMPLLGVVSALAIAAGGSMSYGMLQGYAQADTLPNFAYGFIMLILQGGAWGTFACGLIGLLLQRRRPGWAGWLAAAAAVYTGGTLLRWGVVDLAGFHVNPGRSNGSVSFIGGALGWFAWLALSRHLLALRGALLGFLGFGMGMALGRLLANALRLQPFAINHWNVMEVSVGLIGGFVFTWGMLGRVPQAEETETPLARRMSWGSGVAIVYLLALIPLLHRLLRIRPERKLAEWTEALAGYGFADPARLAQLNLWGVNAVCALAVGAAVVWLWLHWGGRERAGWFPPLALCGAMLLIQSLNALYPYYPRVAGSINMHFVLWLLYAALGLTALAIQRRPVLPETGPSPSEPVPWMRWLGVTSALYVLILLLSSAINGPETMASANTRWPIWEWKDGPFPR